MNTVHEKRVRDIARQIQEKAGTFAFAYWFTDFRLPCGAHVFVTGGGRAKKPVSVWFTYGQSTKQQSNHIATFACKDAATLYADIAGAIDRLAETQWRKE